MSGFAEVCIICFSALALAGGGQAQSSEDLYLQKLSVATLEANRGNLSSAEAEVRAAILSNPAASSGWYELGSVLGQAGDFPGAELAFRRAIELQPAMAKAHFSLALTLIANPQNKLDWPAAIAECQEALKYQPNYPEAANLLGAGLANTGQTEEAIRTLEGVIRSAPALPEAHMNLGQAYESKDRWEDAAREYRAAVAAKGDYPAATTGLAKLLLKDGKPQLAERELEEALCINPDLTEAHYTLARVLRSLHRDEEATVEFAEAKELMERQPNGVHSAQLSNEGLEVARKGDLPRAIAILRKAIDLKPDNGVPHYNLGLILADSGDLAGAQKELADAISLMPTQHKVWLSLGRVLQLKHDQAGALKAVSWAAHLSPSDTAIEAELATMRAGEAANITAAAQESPTQQPAVGAARDTAAGHFAFAMELNAQKEFQGEVGELLRSLALAPAIQDARRSLAAAYVELGDKDRAALEYNKILRCAPKDVAAQIALGKLLLTEGATVEALRHLQLAVVYGPDSAEAQGALREAEKLQKKH